MNKKRPSWLEKASRAAVFLPPHLILFFSTVVAIPVFSLTSCVTLLICSLTALLKGCLKPFIKYAFCLMEEGDLQSFKKSKKYVVDNRFRKCKFVQAPP